MGFHRARPPLVVRPGFSRRFALLMISVHAVALSVVLIMPFAFYSLPLLITILLGGGYVGVVHVLRRAPWSTAMALWQSDGSWQLTCVDGRLIDASLSASTFVSLPLVVLNFRCGVLQRRALPLFRDALEAEQLRQLRQWLRIEGTQPPVL